MKKLRKLLKILGPGFITGASDDDPSGIATYSQTGAQFGYSQLWTSLWVFPFMTVIQEMCGRIGMVTGKGLAGVIRKHYPKAILYICVVILLLANTVNIGADLGAMAASAELIFGIPFAFWLIGMTVLTLILEVFVSYQVYAKVLKYLTMSLFTYIVAVFIVQQDWGAIIQATLIPTIQFNKEFLMNIIALLGTSISPYLFFWQAGEEVEEQVSSHKIRSMGRGIPHVTKSDLRNMRMDTVIGMFFSNMIQFFIIATTASTLHVNGIFQINSAAEAASALRPVAGDFAFLLFAFGVIGTGLLAVPVLAGSAAYAFAEAFGWREGLYLKFKQAHGFYGVITIATLIGLLVNFTKIDPFQMLYYTAILNGIAAPPLMAIILLICNNPKIMGKHTNGFWSNFLGWIITGVMAIASIALLITFI
jgi:NRAMP (natural resistance-associated macrophage protein)-like metal ion transporter